MTWWIGRPWKAGNGWSEAVLRAEGAPHAPSAGVPPAGSGAVSYRRCGLERGRKAVTGAGWLHPFPSRTRSLNAPAPTILADSRWDNRSLPPSPSPLRRGVEQWQLVGLITRRSQVRILPPLPFEGREPRTCYNES